MPRLGVCPPRMGQYSDRRPLEANRLYLDRVFEQLLAERVITLNGEPCMPWDFICDYMRLKEVCTHYFNPEQLSGCHRAIVRHLYPFAKHRTSPYLDLQAR